MRLILDENMPHPLTRLFPGHEVTTVQDIGLAGTKNGKLLAAIEGRFDVFITADKNLRYQQNLRDRTLAVVELPTNRLPALRPLFEKISLVAPSVAPGSYTVIS
jgi:hypothetical protein